MPKRCPVLVLRSPCTRPVPLDLSVNLSVFCWDVSAASHVPAIGFISGAVRGVAGSAFVDFGPEHNVRDKDGELCRSVSEQECSWPCNGGCVSRALRVGRQAPSATLGQQSFHVQVGHRHEHSHHDHALGPCHHGVYARRKTARLPGRRLRGRKDADGVKVGLLVVIVALVGTAFAPTGEE